MTKVLITGFEGYWDYSENSSEVVGRSLCNVDLLQKDIIYEQMPVSFKRVADKLRSVVAIHKPSLLIMLGQSGGSEKIKLERTALNLMDSKLADNDGYIPDEEPIEEGERDARFTNVPIKQILSEVKSLGYDCKISNSCGLYVCNRLYYEALKLCQEYQDMKHP